MSNLPVIGAAALAAIALTGLPLPQAQAAPTGSFVPISSYDDDPFPADSVVERMGRSLFAVEEGGQRLLSGPLGAIEEEPVVYRENPTTGDYIPFALNPWWPHARLSNAAGDFRFPDEERFPLHRVERDANGKVVLVDGLQHWLPQDLHRGMTTVFEAAHAALDAAQLWSGRRVAWGKGGRLEINTHAFIDFNAFYSPTAQMLFFGVVPHRLPGEPSGAPVKMFETATSWEIAAHEAAHAIHAELKPNRVLTDTGYRTWGESFGDQMAMWVSLRDSGRGLALVAETNGVLDRSNSLTRMGEAFAALVGEGTGLRDAFHDKKVSDTSPEVHDRSEVLTGALYDFFLGIYGGLRRDHGPAGALKRAGRILGTFLVRAADFTPENRMTLEDVAKAYLKVDRELYDGRYHAVLVDEFTRRELFDAGSLGEWLDHEAATPPLWLRPQAADREVEQWLQAHLDALGVAPDFGLRLQSVTRSHLLRPESGSEHTLVRVQLILGRGEGATPFENHGVLVFRPNGTLADYHAPLPPADPAARSSAAFAQAEARATIAEAHARGLGQRGAPLSIVREPDGRLTAEVSVVRGEGLGAYMEVFTLDNPSGERREIPIPPVPPHRRIPVPDDLLE